MKFEILNLSCGYGELKVIENFSISLKSGEILSLIGPNGVGKTTIFKTILGFLKPFNGDILADDKSIFKLSDKQRAKILSYVPQSHTPPFSYKVLDVVLMSKMASKNIFSSVTKSDIDESLNSLKTLEILDFKDRFYTNLSGGERQMVLIARAINQDAKIILLDEPTANLDYSNSVKVLKCLKNLANLGYIIIMTTHNPSQAFYLNSKAMMIDSDKNYIYGDAKEVINDKNLKKVYGVDIKVVKNIIDKKEFYSCVVVD